MTCCRAGPSFGKIVEDESAKLHSIDLALTADTDHRGVSKSSMTGFVYKLLLLFNQVYVGRKRAALNAAAATAEARPPATDSVLVRSSCLVDCM